MARNISAKIFVFSAPVLGSSVKVGTVVGAKFTIVFFRNAK
jgi:hypothetical protein